MREPALQGHAFEQLCRRIFEYNYPHQVAEEDLSSDMGYDILVRDTDRNIDLVIEVKWLRTGRPSQNLIFKMGNQLDAAAVSENSEKILVLTQDIPTAEKTSFREEAGWHILDLGNLMYMAEGNELLEDELKQTAAVVMDDSNVVIIPKETKYAKQRNLACVEPKKKSLEDQYIAEIMKLPYSDGALFESFIVKVFEHLFPLELSGWHIQHSTEDGQMRYDVVCRVNSGNKFWDMIINEFRSRYIVIEMKNYKDPIPQNTIYVTEKYLFGHALRSVAFLVSRKGMNDNAIRATQAILRENGKLIISLCDEDIVTMLGISKTGGDVSGYLFEKLDKYLIGLAP